MREIKSKAKMNELFGSKFATENEDAMKKRENFEMGGIRVREMRTKVKAGLIDISKVFNEVKNSQVQYSFEELCNRQLNLSFYGKKVYPFAYTEAKLSMALYLRW